MIKATITLQITIDEDTVAEKYPHYAVAFDSVEAFKEALMNTFDTPVQDEDKHQINYLETYGYEVATMDKKEGPWTK